MPAVRTEALRKTYGRIEALAGLDLTVEAGTVFGFLGPNGAGKTTTIRILTGLARPTSGRAWVAGVDVSAHRGQLARRIGCLPEEPAFYPWMTPREYLDFVGRAFALPGPERSQRVSEMLALVGLEEVSGRRIGGFSRGMRQRLGIAQALVNRPEVLFLDEPVSALDPAGRREVLDMIERLRGHCTVFMSTHILADVERVCDSVGIIAHGRLITQAPRQALMERYAVPAFDLECDGDCAADLRAWADAVSEEPWVASVALSGATAHVVVRDTERAKRELLPSALSRGLVVSHYETVRPSLEDVFLRLVGEEGGVR